MRQTGGRGTGHSLPSRGSHLLQLDPDFSGDWLAPPCSVTSMHTSIKGCDIPLILSNFCTKYTRSNAAYYDTSHCSLISLRALPLLHHVVSREEILGVSHMLELEVVVRRILKKHGPLLPWCTFKSQCRGNDERRTGSIEIVDERVELGLAEDGSKVSNRHFVSVYRVVIVGTAVVCSYIVTN
jgi:hypothetical protein